MGRRETVNLELTWWKRKERERDSRKEVHSPFNTSFVPAVILHCCCSSVTKSCCALGHPVDCSTPGLPDLHHLPQFAQTHVPRVGDAIQPSHPLLSPSPSALNLSRSEERRVGKECTSITALDLKLMFLYYLHCCCSVAKSCPTLWDPMSCSTPGFPGLHYLPEFAQTHVH